MGNLWAQHKHEKIFIGTVQVTTDSIWPIRPKYITISNDFDFECCDVDLCIFVVIVKTHKCDAYASPLLLSSVWDINMVRLSVDCDVTFYIKPAVFCKHEVSLSVAFEGLEQSRHRINFVEKQNETATLLWINWQCFSNIEDFCCVKVNL